MNKVDTGTTYLWKETFHEYIIENQTTAISLGLLDLTDGKMHFFWSHLNPETIKQLPHTRLLTVKEQEKLSFVKKMYSAVFINPHVIITLPIFQWMLKVVKNCININLNVYVVTEEDEENKFVVYLM
jgi:hypothetical protein